MKGFEEILNEVCFGYGYINYEALETSLRHTTGYAHKELRGIIEDVARNYSKEAERYYKLNDDLEDEVDELKGELLDKDNRIKELEEKLDMLEGGN